ncbi:tetratricopeptide repeat protein, partial [Microbispora rosea]
ALQHHPNDPDLHVTIATLNSAQARYEDALRCCELAITFSPGHERAIEGQVYVLRQLGHFDRAEQVAKSALNQNHCSVSLYTELGRVYDAQLKFDAALASFASALELDPNDTEVNIARSATLRSLRRWSLAERDISRLRQVKLHDLDLLAELGWIYHDQGLLGEAERKFKDLLEKAVSEEEKALAHQCLGWVAFAADNFPGAELEFREALSQQPGDESHLLAVAWSLARQGSKERWREAQEIIYSIEGRRPISISTSAQICLGVLSFKLGSPASAEHHFKKALEIDPFHASHTDLGALYAQIGRDDEAEAQLSKAIERDWYDVAAHIELGSLALRKGDDHLRDAEREFRRSLGIEPVSADAAVGLAQVLIRHGDESEAETVLRSVLVSQNRTQRWRLHLALARLLIQRGDKSQNSDLHAEAYAHAQHAIEVAPDREADPHYVAGIAQHRIGSSLVDGAGRLGYRRRAVQHLRQCLKRDPAHIEAQRSLQIIEREMKASRPAVWGGYAIATISFSLLAVMWTSFFVGNKVTAVMVTTATPILAGMFTIAVLLPALIRFKLPGFEADLQAGSSVVAPGPTGDVTFGPGRFTVTFGPKGQLSRREAPLQN